MSSAAGTSSPARPQPVKLLVFAGVPPPVHGQSVMVAALLDALREDPAFEVVHIDPQLSIDSADIGRGRPGKLFSLLGACARALRTRCKYGRMIFYYVPAPARRVPVFRDWIVMALCRPFFSGVVLHWHAVGLGRWTAERANPLERLATRLALGRARLAITLASELTEDAAYFRPKKIVAIPNGIPDPLQGASVAHRVKKIPTEVLFLGLGSEDKGLFRSIDAVLLANAREPRSFRLTFAGTFPSAAEETRFRQVETASQGIIRHAGFANEQKKAALFSAADVLCFPTHYAHEGQPLVLIEALAYDLPIITTRWRAIPGMLPQTPQIQYVDPAKPAEIAVALLSARAADSPAGAHRRHFLEHFTIERHLLVMKEQLRTI